MEIAAVKGLVFRKHLHTYQEIEGKIDERDWAIPQAYCGIRPNYSAYL